MQRFEGDKEVLRNLFRKKRYVEQGDVRQYDYRHTIFASTGVLRGVQAAGMGCALERYNLSQLFVHMLGSSTGACAGQYLPPEQIREHIDLYWEEAASEQFISFRRLFKGDRPVEDTEFLCDAFKRRLDLKRFYASRVEFHVGVTCALSGKGRFLDAKRQDLHPVEVVRASMSIPGLSGGPVEIDGHPYYDGAGAMGMPIREIIEQFSPTDLLIFPNCPGEDKGGAWGQLLSGVLLTRETLAVQKAFLTRHERFAEGIRYLRGQSSCRWAIVWNDDSVGQFERDTRKLQEAATSADRFMTRLLDEAQAQVDAESTYSLAAQ
jgi:predicted patatin/cPLA2 family phospholipase